MKSTFFRGFLIVFLSAMFMSSVYAGGKGSRKCPPPVPEPVSCLIFLASGATYAGMRYLRGRKKSNGLDKEICELNEGRPID